MKLSFKHIDVFQPDVDESEGVTSEGESVLMFIAHYITHTHCESSVMFSSR